MMETSTPRWLHRYATFVAFATFILIIAGALVTSNDAALSIPSWPAPFHWPVAMGPGGRFELSHRVVAGTVSTLTIILALLLWKFEPRRWVRRLGAVAVLAVLAQAILGGVTVLLDLPVLTSVGHACLGQIFFCIMVSLAMFTRHDWRWDEPKARQKSGTSLRTLAAATTGLIFLQLILGAAFRHHGFGIIPHVIGAGLVSIAVPWVLLRVLKDFRHESRLTRTAWLFAGLVFAQVALGIGSYWEIWTNLDAPQPLPPVVYITTAHVAVGALVLAASMALTFEAYRLISVPQARDEAPSLSPLREKAAV
jgi:heme a synthase